MHPHAAQDNQLHTTTPLELFPNRLLVALIPNRLDSPTWLCGLVRTPLLLVAQRNVRFNPMGVGLCSPGLPRSDGGREAATLGCETIPTFKPKGVAISPTRTVHQNRLRAYATVFAIHPESQTCGDESPAR